MRGLPRPQVSDIVWYNRDKWDVTMWRMVGRPERSDPDELIYNLFHSSTREKGFNFVGYQNENRSVWYPCYDTQKKLRAFAAGNTAALDIVAPHSRRSGRRTGPPSARCWCIRRRT